MEKKKPAPAVESSRDIPSELLTCPDLLTPKETAKILRTSPSMLSEWRRKRNIDLPYIKVGKSVYYDRMDVIRFLERNKVRRTEPDSYELRAAR